MIENPQNFRGLNNRIDPTALGRYWLTVAENVVCDDAGLLSSAPTSRPVAQNVADTYATHDGRLLVIDPVGTLAEMDTGGNRRTLATGLTGGPFAWAEQGNALFLLSETQAWVCYPSGAIRWGYLCPAPDPRAEPYPIGPRRAYPPPFSSGPIAPWRTQMIVAVYEAERDRTVLYKSRPGMPHEFYLDSDFMLIPGEVRLLAATAKGLVIGTNTAIYLDAEDAPIIKATTYGVPEGTSAHYDADEVFFWTHRGLCAAFPFRNLTDAAWIAPRHARADVGLLEWFGSRYAAVSLSGPVSDFSDVRPFTPAVPQPHFSL